MTWTGEPTGEGGLVIRTRLLADGERPPMPLLAVGGDRGRDRVRMCSWCNRIAAGDRWLEAETAARRLGLFLDREVPTVTHGICPPCMAGLTGEALASDAA